MVAQWTPEDRARKRRVVEGLLRSEVATLQANHPTTGKPCTRGEAVEILRDMQVRMLRRYEEKHGLQIAHRYRVIIDEALEQLQREAVD